VLQGNRPTPYLRRLRADSKFFFELQFCNEHGIPHSQFLAWDPVDQIKMLAFAIVKNEHCVMCGTSQWEWDPKQGGKRAAYEAVEVFCPGCYAKASMRQLDAGRNTDGITVELVPNDTSLDTARRRVSTKRMRRDRG
jgi:hypothetical protein